MRGRSANTCSRRELKALTHCFGWMVNREPEMRAARMAPQVTFPSQSPILLRNVPSGNGIKQVDIPASLHLPAPGTGDGSAVVVLQGLGGPKDHRERAYGAFLAERGRVALVPNSFAGRNIRWRFDDIRALFLTETMMTADAFAALSYLAGRADVDPRKIFVIGFSYGGMISVLTAYRQVADLFLPDGPRFAGHVSYYGCSIPRLEDPRTTGSPVLMLMARRDRNVCLERTGQIAADLRTGGSPVRLEILDAYHQWDGNDEKKRHVLFNLRSCRMRIDRRNEVRDERTGLRMTGLASRTALIALSADPRGYTIQQHLPTQQETDRMLLTFIKRVGRGVGDGRTAPAPSSQAGVGKPPADRPDRRLPPDTSQVPLR